MTLKVHHLRPAPGAKTAKTRVGRGEASKGKTAGRGTKGTKARYQVPASFQVVNVAQLNALFPQGGSVGVDELVAAGAVRKNQPVKVLGNGDIAVAVQVSAHAFSDTAKSKIAAAGGSVTELA